MLPHFVCLQTALQSSHMIAELAVIKNFKMLLLNMQVQRSLAPHCVVTSLILAFVDSFFIRFGPFSGFATNIRCWCIFVWMMRTQMRLQLFAVSGLKVAEHAGEHHGARVMVVDVGLHHVRVAGLEGARGAVDLVPVAV